MIPTRTATPGPVPDDAGLLEFRRNVQSADQGAASHAHRHQKATTRGTEGFGAMPYQGTVLAHSNESEWKKFSRQSGQ